MKQNFIIICLAASFSNFADNSELRIEGEKVKISMNSEEIKHMNSSCSGLTGTHKIVCKMNYKTNLNNEKRSVASKKDCTK